MQERACRHGSSPLIHNYLTRRLVDVSQDVIEEKRILCKNRRESQGISVGDIRDGNEIIEPMLDRITGRYAAEDIVHPETGEILVKTNEIITYDMAERIVKLGIKRVNIRSVLTCRTEHGVCAKCYGSNLATGDPVNVGEAVGIIIAQSIGEQELSLQ